MKSRALSIAVLLAATVAAAPLAEQAAQPAPAPGNAKLDAFKQEAVADVEGRAVFAQQMVDQIFSYGELGFQETETNRYLIDLSLIHI